MDLVGPLQEDNEGNRYILTLQCELAKFVECYPLPNKESTTLAKSFVNNFILRCGIPHCIILDRDFENISSTLKETCKILKIKPSFSTAYHHETLGSLENSHKHLNLLKCEKHGTWSSWLPFWCFSYNNSVHIETRYTPYKLVFEKTCNLPTYIKKGTEPLYNCDCPSELKYRLQSAWLDAKSNLIKSIKNR